MRAGRRQEVTGLVVNDKLGIDRKTLRRFRATLFQIERDGPEGKRWGTGGNVLASIVGFAAYVTMVDEAKGKPLLERARALAAQHGYRAQRTVYPSSTRGRGGEAGEAADGGSSADRGDTSESDEAEQGPATRRKRWWQFWKS
jgi:hypothetical protein